MDVAAAPDAFAEVEQALEAFRVATGLSVCFKLFKWDRVATVAGELVAKYGLHRSAFCTEVKRTLNDRCKECDLRKVTTRCEEEREIFSHVCHAGAGEVIIPLFVDEVLVAAAYVGQFRTTDEQPRELRKLSAKEHARVIGLSRLLGAYLGDRLRSLRFVSESSLGYRGEVVRRFLEKNLRERPTLPGLATHLGLSSTRTAHVVREVTGMSFVELRDSLRMERAKNLLGGTYHKVAHIADECGFSSAQYFHRFFRRQTRTTPLAYRRRQRTGV